jgi:hypothetical protein
LNFFFVSLFVHFLICSFVIFTIQNTTQTSIPPEGIEPSIPASNLFQTLALDRSATRNSIPESSSS